MFFLRHNIAADTLYNVELLYRCTFSKDSIFHKLGNDSILITEKIATNLAFEFSVQVYI